MRRRQGDSDLWEALGLDIVVASTVFALLDGLMDRA
jgi:hypothetical protein